ncbi:GntR family transcriptional regulator [Acrocarpospora sp. B8E8]|uniref:GntR family transcriptional regulator n=1 Tax=Acrocarpospora sp. B8E8 TaxID=3153572 RepID=UPI00325CB3A6
MDVNDTDWRPGKPDVVDREGPVPVYVQIAGFVKDMIERGELAVGELVPTEAELSGAYGIARMTARRVHRELRERGLAYTVPSAGTFVGRRGVTPSPYVMPAYVVIARDLARLIQAGVYPSDRAIPTHRALSKQYEVCVDTAQRAVKVVREAGWAFSRGARGTFVASPDQWPDPEVWRKVIVVACGAGWAEDATRQQPPDAPDFSRGASVGTNPRHQVLGNRVSAGLNYALDLRS